MSVPLDSSSLPLLDSSTYDNGIVSESQSLLHGSESPRDGLTSTEKINLAWLSMLYLLQSVPLGFTSLTMPVLLRQRLSYAIVGSFSVAEYPYSLKAAWSPLVDNVYSSALGRRKSWLVPLLFCMGGILLGLGIWQNALVGEIVGRKTQALVFLVTAWFILVMLCATMDIATDGWALDLLSKPNVHWATTAHAFGLSSGYFIAFNLFLVVSPTLRQPDGALSPNESQEILSPARFLCSWGVVFIFCATLLAVFKREHPSSLRKSSGLREAYGVIWQIVTKRNVQTLMLVHLTCTSGFQANDSITTLQLVKSGFTNKEIAALATVSFPCELLCGVIVSMMLRHQASLKVWRRLFPARLVVAVIAQGCVFVIQHYESAWRWRWFLALVEYLLSKSMETAMFIALYAFHNQVADANYGGVYMTVLATTTNLGCALPRFIYLKAVGAIDGDDGQQHSWRTPALDGYQIVNASGVAIAIPMFWFWLRPATVALQRTSPDAWKLS